TASPRRPVPAADRAGPPPRPPLESRTPRQEESGSRREGGMAQVTLGEISHHVDAIFSARVPVRAGPTFPHAVTRYRRSGRRRPKAGKGGNAPLPGVGPGRISLTWLAVCPLPHQQYPVSPPPPPSTQAVAIRP